MPRTTGDRYRALERVRSDLHRAAASGLAVQGGMSTGRTTIDNCEVARQLPELLTNVPVLGGAKQRPVPPAVLPPAVAIPDAAQVPRVVHDPEDRRTGQRRAAERAWSAGDRQLRGEQRRRVAVTRPPARRQRGQRHREPGRAGRHVRRSAESVRPAAREGASVRRPADEAERRPEQRVQCERGVEENPSYAVFRQPAGILPARWYDSACRSISD